jgi:hypothetical protein
VIGAAIGQTVNQPPLSVEGEDDKFCLWWTGRRIPDRPSKRALQSVRQHTYTHMSDPIGKRVRNSCLKYRCLPAFGGDVEDTWVGKRSSLDFLLLATDVFGSERTGEASWCSNHRWQIDVGQ